MGAIAKNDGGVVAGSQKVTIGTKSYVAKNIKLPKGASNRQTRPDENGNEDGQWWTSKIPTGSMSLQFPDATTAAPDEFAEVTLTPRGGGAGIVFICYNITETYEAGGLTMCDCEIAKKVGTSGGNAQ